MRKMLVGALVATLMGAGAAYAGTMDGPAPASERAVTGEVNLTYPAGAVIHEERHSAAAEFGLALASTGLNLVYHPVRMAYGLLGAAVGGFGGWTTGGDPRTAHALWRPTVEGDYYIRPGHLDRSERFRFNGTVPNERVSYVVQEPAEPAAPAAPPSLDDELDDDSDPTR